MAQLTTKEAAAYLGMSVPTLRKHIYQRDESPIQGIKRGSMLFFEQDELDAFKQWLDEHHSTKPGPKPDIEERQTMTIIDEQTGEKKRVRLDYKDRREKLLGVSDDE